MAHIRWTDDERRLVAQSFLLSEEEDKLKRLRSAQQVLPENRWRQFTKQIADKECEKLLAIHLTPAPIVTEPSLLFEIATAVVSLAVNPPPLQSFKDSLLNFFKADLKQRGLT